MIKRELVGFGIKLLSVVARRQTVALLHETQPPGEYTLVAAALLWVADLLETLEFLNHRDRLLILEEFHPRLRPLAEAVARGDRPLVQLVFAEGRYVTWTGAEGFLWLTDGDYLKQLPGIALETVSYNITELVRRQLERVNGAQDGSSPEADLGGQ